MKKEIAEQLMKDLLSLSEAMNNVVYQIDFIDEENKKRVYLRAISELMASSYTKLMLPLIKEYPDLDPDKNEPA
ncbi:MAG: hypothetical protein ABL884_04260 [Methyloglobulus sp.]